MTFLKNIWYVAAWSQELGRDQPIGRVIAGEPVVFYRQADGTVAALEDRCPHRLAPLSLGRIRGDDLQCGYHGLTLGSDGRCKSIPGTRLFPPHVDARAYPVVEQWDWIWVWLGEPSLAGTVAIPEAYGLTGENWRAVAGGIDYEANYELINDNLCDLSHLDFVHETTLGAATCRSWSDSAPRITPIENGLLFERWFQDHPLAPDDARRVDTWSRVRYLLPGLFLMDTKFYPVGAAQASEFGPPRSDPFFFRVDQQAVTPISQSRTRYLYASGVVSAEATDDVLDKRMAVVNAAFAEDKKMIEAQQKIWDLTPPDHTKAFLPQDKGPAMFRRMLASRLAKESA